MQTYTYVSKGKFELREKPKPVIMHERDAIVKVTLASICSSDLHIKHGSVPRAVLGITVGHEMVGIVEEVGGAVTHVKPGDRVTVNVETFCGECYFCKKGYVNNCTDQNGGWALGCRIDGGQAEYVRVPFADQGLNKIPDEVTERQALFVGDVLATGYWATRISEITEDDTVLIIGAGPTGICTLLCVMLKSPKHIIMCEKDEDRIQFINKHYPDVLTVSPEVCEELREKVLWKKKRYDETDLESLGNVGEASRFVFVLAAAAPEVNEKIVCDCRKKKIPVNNASNRDQCDFYFPGIAKDGDTVVGITSGGGDHRLAAKISAAVRQILRTISV